MNNYLVTNIKFNDGEAYVSKIPIQYTLPPLAQVYLRSEIFYQQELTFDYKPVLCKDYNTTKYFTDWQDWDAEIGDYEYDDTIDYKVIPMHNSVMYITVEDERILQALGDPNNEEDIKQEIFEQLMMHMEIRFVYYRE